MNSKQVKYLRKYFKAVKPPKPNHWDENEYARALKSMWRKMKKHWVNSTPQQKYHIKKLMILELEFKEGKND